MGTIGYLLDTHSFLWAVSEGQELSDNAKKAIESMDMPLFVSAISAYEIMNKYRIGKLPGYADVAEKFRDILKELGADELPVSMQHAHYAGEFEWGHRDPFDRLLAAQASIENLTLITNDSTFNSLPWVTTLW